MKTAIRFEAVVMALLAAAPAFAQATPSDTIKVLLEKGATFGVQGQSYPFIAKADGSYVDAAGAKMGTYRVDGAKLCVTPGTYPQEICFTMPAGKKSGDAFEAQGDSGPASITIR